MHAFTKILVLLASIVSVLLAALTVAFASNYSEVKQNNRELSVSVSDFSRKLSTQAAVESSNQSRLVGELADMKSQFASVQAELRQAQQSASEFRAQIEQLKTDKSVAEAKANQATALAETSTRVADSLRTEVSQLWQEKTDLNQQVLQLRGRTAEMEAQYDVAEQTIRTLREQLTEIRTTGTAIASGAPAPGGSAAMGIRSGSEPVVTRRIDARITEVGRDPSTGETLAKLDVGRNDGVSSGMSFTLFRGSDQFLARMRIEKVDLQSCVGRVDFLGKTGIDIRPNDRAYIAPR